MKILCYVHSVSSSTPPSQQKQTHNNNTNNNKKPQQSNILQTNNTWTYLFFKWHRNQGIDFSARGHKESAIKIVQSSAPLEGDSLLLLHVQYAATAHPPFSATLTGH